MNSGLFNLALAGYILAGIFYLIGQVFKSPKSGIAGQRAVVCFPISKATGQRAVVGLPISQKAMVRLPIAAAIAQATAVFLLSAGFLFHSLCLLKRGLKAGHFPVIGLYETLLFSAWCAVLVYLILEKISEFKFLGGPVSLSAILILGYASILDKSLKPLMPALKSNWITIHVISYFLGYAGLLIAFIVSLIYLFARQRDAAFSKKMDDLSYKMVSFAFPFLTLGLTTGAVWAKNAWGRYWSWDPKETWALITWLIYAAYLHLRLTKDWQGKKAAILNIIGFLCVLFTFLGVNYLMKGLHSYL